MDYMCIVLTLSLLVVLPLAWLVSEFSRWRWLRMTLGIGALALSYFVAWGVGEFTRLNYNASYGSASSEFIDTVIANVEAGNDAELLRELRLLKNAYHPTYENRANYDELVLRFVERLKKPRSE